MRSPPGLTRLTDAELALLTRLLNKAQPSPEMIGHEPAEPSQNGG